MKLSAYPFVFDPSERSRLLSQDEHDGLSCLLDRARQFGGEDDIFFLCMTTCSVLVRFARGGDTGALTASGFAFRKQQESWVWLYLPSLLRAVFEDVPDEKHVSFCTEDAPKFDAWLSHRQPQLFRSAQQFACDTARQIHPYSVAWTHISPSQYSDDGIAWYTLPARRGEEEHICRQQPEDVTRCLEEGEDDGTRIVPPTVTRTWRVVRDGEKHKLGRVDDVCDWYGFARSVREALEEE